MIIIFYNYMMNSILGSVSTTSVSLVLVTMKIFENKFRKQNWLNTKIKKKF